MKVEESSVMVVAVGWKSSPWSAARSRQTDRRTGVTGKSVVVSVVVRAAATVQYSTVVVAVDGRILAVGLDGRVELYVVVLIVVEWTVV